MMNAQAEQILLAFLAICSPFLLAFLIVSILAPRYKDFAERKGWTVQPHPQDHRDHVFRGEQNGIPWEMEHYILEHYRKLGGRYIPFTNVIVWSTHSVKLHNHTILIHPRRDRLKHVVHPRLSLEKDKDMIANHERERLEDFLFRLPQKDIGSAQFQELFLVRTDLDTLPVHLINRLPVELFAWQKIQMIGPVILINNHGLTIWWIPLGMRNEWLEKTLLLGISVASVL